MKIVVKGDKAHVYAKYNSEFVARIKSIRGSEWKGEMKCWEVPSNCIDAVREIMRNIYGFDDRTEHTIEYVDLRVEVLKELREEFRNVTLFGKILSSSYSSKSKAQAGDDVVYIQGAPRCEGDRKYWYCIVPAGSIIYLSQVPRSIYDKYIKENENKDSEYVKVTVREPDNKMDCVSLTAEKERLLQRIAEIDRLLEDCQETK